MGELAAIRAIPRRAATWQAARAAGWSDTELAELFANVAANMYTNYFNHYMQTEPDLPPAPGLDGWSPRT